MSSHSHQNGQISIVLEMEDICLWLSKFEDLGRKSFAVLEDYQQSLILASETENTKTHFPNHMKINQKNY